MVRPFRPVAVTGLVPPKEASPANTAPTLVDTVITPVVVTARDATLGLALVAVPVIAVMPTNIVAFTNDTPGPS